MDVIRNNGGHDHIILFICSQYHYLHNDMKSNSVVLEQSGNDTSSFDKGLWSFDDRDMRLQRHMDLYACCITGAYSNMCLRTMSISRVVAVNNSNE